MTLRDRSRKFIGPSPTNASSDGMLGRSAAVRTAMTPGNAAALLVSIDTIRCMGMRAALDPAPQHPGSTGIGGEQRPPGDLIHAVGANRPSANDLEMGFEVVHRRDSPGAYPSSVSIDRKARLMARAIADREQRGLHTTRHGRKLRISLRSFSADPVRIRRCIHQNTASASAATLPSPTGERAAQ